MPLYSYECTVCGHQFQDLRDIHDERVVRCVGCGGETQRLITPVQVRVRGEAKTDFNDVLRRSFKGE